MKRTNITELINLPKPIQEEIINFISYGIENEIIYHKDRFRKLKNCSYTAHCLSVSSDYKIKVVEGYFLHNNKKHFHTWNYYKGYHFCLVKNFPNHLEHYGEIIGNQRFKKYLKKKPTDENGYYRMNILNSKLYK